MAPEKTEEKEEKVEIKVEKEIEVKDKSPDQVEEKLEPIKTEVKEKSAPKKEEKIGIAHIHSSSNNSLVHITDLSGNTISRITGGMVTKHSRLKSNPTIAMFVAKKAAERAKDLGFTALYIRMKAKTGGFGHGPGSHAAVKSLGKEGFRIINILDTTKFPRGGPKKKGGRRGRRV
tara:strand:- start:1322 stop:1846 length:525 start_codon:yes stop_codon:yes gene_type:complete